LKQQRLDSNQFVDNVMRMQPQSQAAQEMNSRPFKNNNGGASIKPLGLDKSKARAALNNLKNLSSTPRSSQEQQPRKRSASLSIAELKQQHQSQSQSPSQASQS